MSSWAPSGSPSSPWTSPAVAELLGANRGFQQGSLEGAIQEEAQVLELEPGVWAAYCPGVPPVFGQPARSSYVGFRFVSFQGAWYRATARIQSLTGPLRTIRFEYDNGSGLWQAGALVAGDEAQVWKDVAIRFRAEFEIAGVRIFCPSPPAGQGYSYIVDDFSVKRAATEWDEPAIPPSGWAPAAPPASSWG